MLKSEKPNVNALRVFSCGAYVYILEEKRKNKLAPRSELMTYIGVESGVKGYYFMQKSGAMFLGATATFDKTLFPYCKSAKTPALTELSELPPSMEEHNHSNEDSNDGDDDDFHHHNAPEKRKSPPASPPSPRPDPETLVDPKPPTDPKPSDKRAAKARDDAAKAPPKPKSKTVTRQDFQP